LSLREKTIDGELVNSVTFEHVMRLYAYEIRKKADKPPIFKIIGGPTGYESFYMHKFVVDKMSISGWVACAGMRGSWDRLSFTGEEMRKAFEGL